MSTKCRLRVCGLVTFAAFFATQSFAASDLYLRDTASDTGVEPYIGPGPVYLSPDIWVRNEPDPNWEPYPFATASPPWTPLPHQNPEYRDSKTGQPNYVYVRIQNRGDQPSIGTERLRLYQAKASTGLAWPASWVDNVGLTCGADRLLGIEITKPRRNAKSVTPTERAAYRDALLAIQTDPNFQYSDGVQYWRKQNDVHSPGNPNHGNPAFLAWHREMMNGYEELLKEANPLVTLLYWDWTEDPRTGTNLFSTDFMGVGNGTVAAPLVPLRPPTLTRNVGGTATDNLGNIVCAAPLFESDVSFNGIGDFPPLGVAIESVPNHDCAHGFIGGYITASAGQISFLNTAAQDPFFFLLHANVDRLWANWQRQNGDPTRLDPVATYGGDSSNPNINDTMSPWDGATGLAPWTGPAAYSKTSKDRSVVYPPIYDTAPLNIPVLQPGDSVVIELPWYPPNVNNFNCAGQAGHFCLLARIETATSAPFGMSSPEGVNVGTNTSNNNNIAWKNVTIVDNVLEPAFRIISGTMIRNIFDREAIFEIALLDRTEERRFLLPELARVSLALPDEILERIRGGDARLQDLELVNDDVARRTLLQVIGREPRFSVPLKANETFTAEFIVALPDADIPRELLGEPFHFDLEQRIDLPGEFFDPQREKAIEVGGVRFTLDFAEILKSRREDADDIELADLQLNLKPIGRQVLSVRAAGDRDVPEFQDHLSVGEPLSIEVTQEPGDTPIRVLSLELDGEEAVSAERTGTLSETVQFDTPGVHTIVARGIDEEGEVIVRRTRVLVSETIPPNAVISDPAPGTHVTLGEEVEITAEAAAAFEREVKEVSLYVKEGDEIVTGQNLVLSENFAPVETAAGPGPHSFSFTPERPGTYMFQVGAVDDAGVIGVSGHVMVMVTE